MFTFNSSTCRQVWRVKSWVNSNAHHLTFDLTQHHFFMVGLPSSCSIQFISSEAQTYILYVVYVSSYDQTLKYPFRSIKYNITISEHTLHLSLSFSSSHQFVNSCTPNQSFPPEKNTVRIHPWLPTVILSEFLNLV